MIERHSVGDPRAAVMTDDGEALVGECGHDLDELARHLALAEALAVRTAGGHMLVHDLADAADDIDIAALVAAADIVFFPHLPL